MEREATIKFGYYFRNAYSAYHNDYNEYEDEEYIDDKFEYAGEDYQHDRTNYRELFKNEVEMLCYSEDQFERRVGFYMIKHTLSSELWSSIPIHQGLRGNIQYLYKNKKENPKIFNRKENEKFCKDQIRLWEEDD